MKICVIGGANVDITAASYSKFVPGDSNPGTIRLSFGGVARNIAHNLVLLGDEVRLLTVFGSGDFGRMTREDCERIGMDLSLSMTALSDAHSCFVSINAPDGEMLGGVADMSATEGLTPSVLAERMPALNASDAVVADCNLSIESLVYLIGHCTAPLYIDAVSGAKAVRLRDALLLSGGRQIHALKCNHLEEELLGEVAGVRRRYVTRGSQGVRVLEGGCTADFPALPATVVNTTGGGDALLAGIVHCGPESPVAEAVRVGLLCARAAVECPDAVNENVANLIKE